MKKTKGQELISSTEQMRPAINSMNWCKGKKQMKSKGRWWW